MGAVALLVAGMVLLIGGAELVVRGGARVAGLVGIPPIVIGLTVVAHGTSAPELAVGIDAARQGADSLAVGNIAGTNVVNLLLILGLTAAIRPLVLELRTIRFDLPVMVGAAVAIVIMCWDGVLSSAEASLLVVAAVIYTVAVVAAARTESAAVREAFSGEYALDGRNESRSRAVVVNVALLAVGIAIIVLGAHWLVDSATDIARSLGVSEAFIGLTVVAIGTSAPELVTMIVSTIRGERDIAVGNILGSSVYNILAILGVTGVVASGGLSIERDLARVDLPVMAVVMALCVPVFLTGRRVSRGEGILFVCLYVVYLGAVIAMST